MIRRDQDIGGDQPTTEHIIEALKKEGYTPEAANELVRNINNFFAGIEYGIDLESKGVAFVFPMKRDGQLKGTLRFIGPSEDFPKGRMTASSTEGDKILEYHFFRSTAMQSVLRPDMLSDNLAIIDKNGSELSIGREKATDIMAFSVTAD